MFSCITCDWICVKLCACCVSTQGPLGAQHFGLHLRTPNLDGFQWGHLVWYCASKQEVGTWHEMEQSVCPFLSPLPTLLSPNLDLNGCCRKGCVHTARTQGAARGWEGACGQRRQMRDAGWGPRKGGGKRAQWDGRAGKEGPWVCPSMWSDLPDHPLQHLQSSFFYHFKFLWWANGLRYISWFVHGCKWCSSKEFTCPCRRGKRCGFDPWVRKIPWRRKWQPTSVCLSGEPHVLVL